MSSYIIPVGGGGGGGSTPASSGQGLTSGTLGNSDFFANENISGGSGCMAVTFNGSGQLIRALPFTPARMPSIGVVTSNYLSGAQVTFYRDGPIFSTAWDWSGFINTLTFVGNSGLIVNQSGCPQSGAEVQLVGIPFSRSGLYLREL